MAEALRGAIDVSDASNEAANIPRPNAVAKRWPPATEVEEEKLAAAASPPSIPSTSLDISKVLSPTMPSSSDGAVLSARGESAASRRAAQRLERASARANSMQISPPQDSSPPVFTPRSKAKEEEELMIVDKPIFTLSLIHI